jgi:ribosome-associated protein
MSSETDTPNREYRMPDESEAFALAERAAFHMLEKKAEDVLVLDLRGRSDFCDFFVLGTGQADVQVKAIAAAVMAGLEQIGEPVHHSEGLAEGRWALLDLVNVLVHVFKPAVREYYQLERLWADAPRLEIAADHFADPTVRARQAERLGSAPSEKGAAGADPR